MQSTYLPTLFYHHITPREQMPKITSYSSMEYYIEYILHEQRRVMTVLLDTTTLCDGGQCVKSRSHLCSS